MIDLVRERLLEMRHQEAVRILRQHPSSTTTAIDAMLAVLDEISTGAVPAVRAVGDDDVLRGGGRCRIDGARSDPRRRARRRADPGGAPEV
jgi:hypothetical protein